MLRSIVIAFALFLTASTAYSQGNACTVNFGAHIGSPACPYQWVGATSISFDGSGNGLGFVGMTTQCRADFGPGARMCTSKEIMESDTLDPNAIPAEGCWVRPVLLSIAWQTDVSGAKELAGDGMSCHGWSFSSSGLKGLRLTSAGGFDSRGLGSRCSQVLPIACCKPTPIPVP